MQTLSMMIWHWLFLFAWLGSTTNAQRPAIQGFTMLFGNCAEMYLNEKPLKIDVQSCADECLRFTGCRGFSFDPKQSDCWLKWGLCDQIKPARLTRVVFYKNDLWGFTAEKGSCPGLHATLPSFTDVKTCAENCRNLANCSGFTYDFESAVCYLKSSACTPTMVSDAVETWVKYFRKDFWTPAALGIDTAADEAMEEPSKMIFFDGTGNFGQDATAAAIAAANNAVGSVGDPWREFAMPKDEFEFEESTSLSTQVFLVHRLTIVNASELACRRACSIDEQCSHFCIIVVEEMQHCVVFSSWTDWLASFSSNSSLEPNSSPRAWAATKHGAIFEKKSIMGMPIKQRFKKQKRNAENVAFLTATSCRLVSNAALLLLSLILIHN